MEVEKFEGSSGIDKKHFQVCLLLCIFFAFILSNVAHTRYSVPVVQQSIAVKKKK